jgi:hypothetical protein
MGTRVAACGSGWSELSLLALLVMVVLGLLLVTPTPAYAQPGQDQPDHLPRFRKRKLRI